MEKLALPAVVEGQVFIYNTRGYEKAIKVTGISNVNHMGIDMRMVSYIEYDMNYGWMDKTSKKTLDDDFFRYYTLFQGDFDLYMLRAAALINGEESISIESDNSIPEGINETALMAVGSKEYVTALAASLEARKNEMQMLRYAMDININNKKRELEGIRDKLNGVIAVFKGKLKQIYRVIDTIELYLGVFEQIVQIQEGDGALPDDKISFRQQVLFLDEEIALEKYNADFTNIEDLDRWLLKDGNYKKFAPESRCVVAFKPRRESKEYSSDSFTNWMMNVPNFDTYLLIRNGDNIYRISSSLTIGHRLFPLRDELGKLLKSMESGWKRDKEESDDKIHQYKRMAFAMQGLIDRTAVFGDIPPGVSIFDIDKTDFVNFIYDDELALPFGKLPYKEWANKNRETIIEGSRIYFQTRKWILKRDGSRFFKEYREYNIPVEPDSGLYQVYKYKKPDDVWSKIKDGSLYIKYLPKSEWYWQSDRKNQIWFCIDTDDDIVLNYDDIDLNDIDFYLNSRTDRRNYLYMLPILLGIKDMLLSDIEWESHFASLLNSRLGGDKMEIILSSIKWWKIKNKWKRSINQDDSKALRMIEARIMKIVNQ